jgi:4-amino-4-deoxy-L-arabinose transferase-like glycosyltransferase
MTGLLLRIPVPWVFVLGYLIGAGIEQIVPVWFGRSVRGNVTFTAGVTTFVIGMALAAWGWATFYRARTTTVPGEASSSLVTWGPYVFSRNPMYLGLAIVRRRSTDSTAGLAGTGTAPRHRLCELRRHSSRGGEAGRGLRRSLHRVSSARSALGLVHSSARRAQCCLASSARSAAR